MLHALETRKINIQTFIAVKTSNHIHDNFTLKREAGIPSETLANTSNIKRRIVIKTKV